MLKEKIKANGRNIVILAFFVSGLMISAGMLIQVQNHEIQPFKSTFGNEAEEDTSTWHKSMEINSWDLPAVGVNALSGGTTGWSESFCLDFEQTPSTYLVYNGTYDDPFGVANDTIRGYVDADDATVDLEHSDPFYFVARCRFTTTTQETGSWNYSRVRANLTVWGDLVGGDTIDDVGIYANVSGDVGDAIISHDDSDYLWVNFYWTDNDDGYSMIADGTIYWQLTIYEKY